MTEYGFRPDLGDTADVELGVTRDGLTQLRRSWPAERPRAVVLIVHGIGEHSGRYEHVARQMVDSRLSVVSYDQRGFGESGGRRAHVSRFGELLDDVQDHLEIARGLGVPVVLLGHSMGGLIAARYAVSSRPQPDVAVLSAPALGTDRPDWMLTPVRAVSGVLSRARVPLPIDLEHLSSDPRVGEAYDADPLVFTTATLGLVGEMAKAMRTVNRRLDAWRLPALVVHGSDDELVPTEVSEPFDSVNAVTRRVYTGRHELFNEPHGPEVISDIIRWVESQVA